MHREIPPRRRVRLAVLLALGILLFAPLAAGSAERTRVLVRIFDGTSGKPTPAMVCIRSLQDGTIRLPPDGKACRKVSTVVDFVKGIRYRKAKDWVGPVRKMQGKGDNNDRSYVYEGRPSVPYWREPVMFQTPAEFSIDLPAGKYRIAVSRGMEYVPYQEDFTVQDAVISKSIVLERWINLAAEGWYSGDVHVHHPTLEEPQRRFLLAYARAEDLHVVNVLEMGHHTGTEFKQRGFGPRFRSHEADYWLVGGQEEPRSTFGHIIGLNVRSLVRDLKTYDFYDIAFHGIHAQEGALVGYAHLAWNGCDLPRGFPWYVTTGELDFVEVLQFGLLNTSDYADYLNLGFRLTAAAGSDVPWGSTIGEVRTYVHAGDGEGKLDVDAWYEGLAKGNTFVTNGPAIELTVNGKPPGSVIRLPEGGDLQVVLRSRGHPAVGLPKWLTLAGSRGVIRKVLRRGEEREIKLLMVLPARESQWILGHTLCGNGAVALTSPVYVIVGNRPTWSAERGPAIIDKQLAAIAAIEHEFEKGSTPREKGIRERLAAARAFYAELRAAMGRAGGKKTVGRSGGPGRTERKTGKEGAAQPQDVSARIRIDPAHPRAPVSRRLFGKFAEHLGHNIYHGMWAQVLRNPGFERWEFFSRRAREFQRLYPKGCAAHWIPLSGVPARFSLQDDAARAKQTSQRIEVDSIPAGKEVGIRQDGIFLPVHRESDYRLSFRCRGKMLASGFAVSIRSGSRVLARAEFRSPEKEWRERTADLTVPRDCVARGTALTLAIEVLSPGTLELDQMELFPRDAIDGFDRDVISQCREARLPLLRYPGGNFVSGYHWRDGIGPRLLRPMRHNPAWDTPEYNHVGTDEFLAFCRVVGCEPLICINAGSGTPEEAAAWVEYVNGAVTTPMGELRARNGHPEPYGVKLWEIGNELYGSWQIGHATAVEYAERYLRFTRAMKAADPGCRFIANGHDPRWNRVLLEHCGKAIRSLSVHPLIGGGTPGDADPVKVFRALMAYPTLFENQVRAFHEWAGERGLAPKVAVTELQIFTNRRGLPANWTLSEALFLGRFIHAAIRLGGEVELITHSALVNHGGGLRKQRGVVYAQPVQAAHVLYGTMTGVRPVTVDVDCGTYAIDVPRVASLKAAPELDAVALVDGTGKELTLVAINTLPGKELRAAVRIDGFDGRVIRARRIGGVSILSSNSLEDPDAVRLRDIEPPELDDGTFRFAPHSITEIVFRVEPRARAAGAGKESP